MSEHQAGAVIRAVRENRGISQRTLAADLGVSPATLSALEAGLTELTVTRLQKAARLLDVSPAHLLGLDEADAPPQDTQVAEQPADRDWRLFDDIVTDPIVRAAILLFVRQGFHATSIREIAADSGFSVAGVYHHYPSKERILVAVLDLTMAEIIWRLDVACQEGHNALESFGLMVESLALFHAVRGDLAFLGASEMRALSPPERARITALRDHVQHELDHQAHACIGPSHVDPDDLRTATRAIATMCTSLPSWFRPNGTRSATEVAHAYAEFALGIIARLVGHGS